MFYQLRSFTKKHFRVIFYLWIFLGLVFAQLVGKTYLSYKDNHTSLENQSENINVLMTAQVYNLYEKMEYTLDFIKSIIEKEKIWERKKLESYLIKFQETHKEIQTLKIFDKNGNYFADTLPTLSKANVSDREYFQDHAKNPLRKFIISGPLLSKSTGEYVIVFSERLNNTDGSFKGLAVITLRASYFKKVFEETKIGKLGSIVLIYDDSTIVARVPWRDDVAAKRYTLPLEVKEALEKNKNAGFFTTQSPVDHEKRFYSYKRIGNTPYLLHVGLSYSEFFKEWRRSAMADFTFFLFVAVFSHLLTIVYCLSLEKIEFQKMNIFRTSKMTTLGEMSSQLAHEINNPLTIIRSSAYTLKKVITADELNKEKAIEYLNKIDTTTTRITKIIAGLRAFSRSGDNDPFEMQNMSKIIQDISELSSHRLKMTSVQLNIVDFTDFTFECRASQIEQVLLNLLNNSIDSIADLPEKWIRIEIQLQKENFTLKFTDSGNGIPQQIAERIMEPFFTTKAVGKGTGLGLSISKGLIESHRGQLTYNNKSKNTEFLIQLPLKQSSANSSKKVS